MTGENDPRDRARRVRRLRTGWRSADRAAEDAPSADPMMDNEERRAESLGSLDQIRSEAPDDLETRRAADAIEREIERSRRKAR